MKKIIITQEIEKSLLEILDSAYKYGGFRMHPLIDLIIRSIVEEEDKKE